MVSQAIHDGVTTHKVTASQHFETVSACTDSHADLEDSTYDGAIPKDTITFGYPEGHHHIRLSRRIPLHFTLDPIYIKSYHSLSLFAIYIPFHIICQDVINIVMHADSVPVNVLPANNKCLVHDNLAIERLQQENDHLFELLLSQDIVHICVNSLGTRTNCREMQHSFINEYNKNLMLKAELAILEHLVVKKVSNEVKGKNVIEKDLLPNNTKVIALGMFRLDLEPLAPIVVKNMDAHIDYIKHTHEHANILRELVEFARAFRHLDNDLDFAYIGILVGYAPTKKAYRICNKRTHLIIETIHIDFDELTTMASEQFSLGPELKILTPRTISSELVPNPPSPTPYVPPTKKDWDILFQPMFDKYSNLPPSVASLVPEVVAPNRLEFVLYDAPSPSTSQTPLKSQPPVIPSGFEEQFHDIEVAHLDNDPFFGDHPLDNVIGNPSRPISTQHQLQTKAMFFYFDAFLNYVEPKNYKEALKESCWIKAMQEELNEFERLKVWELVLHPDRVMIITLKLFKVKLDELGAFLKNKARLVARGYRQEEGINFEESFHQLLDIRPQDLYCHSCLQEHDSLSNGCQDAGKSGLDASTKLTWVELNKRSRDADLSKDKSGPESPPEFRRSGQKAEDRSTTKEKARRERSKSRRKSSRHQEISSDFEHEEGSEDAYEDLTSPYKRSKPTPFTQRITRLKYHQRAKLPRNIRVYEGNKDPEDHLAFMYGHGHPNLAKKLNDKIPKTVDEMFERVRGFIKGEVAARSAEMEGEELASLIGYPYICFLRLLKEYSQIRMAEDDKEKTGFHTEEGVYCFPHMPKELKNSAAILQMMIEKDLADQRG
ncbi:retrovirus-related pol polyprotein from transposon TNT 1-94 [Tanacetum coccineum]